MIYTISKFPSSSELIKLSERISTTDYIFLQTQNVELSQESIDRFLKVANDTGAVMLYSDFFTESQSALKVMPLGEYVKGSVRDDFDFGPVILLARDKFLEAAKEMQDEKANSNYTGLYDLRLRLSQTGEIVHINEPLYTLGSIDKRLSGEKQFDYVNPQNRDIQIEMEQVFSGYLKRINAYLAPITNEIDFENANETFDDEVSVIIPVYNRVGTIRDALNSAFLQKTTFSYNIIVVDNHSTDGTSELLQEMSSQDTRLKILKPSTRDKGIGGCWSLAVQSDVCGKFAVQLDSDDVYSSENTLQKIVDAFYQQKCAMLIGSYTLTDSSLNEIAPGLIDHKEWTDTNGHNNALRINGLGAPRCFYTPIIRSILFPNTSYGEDYAVGLRISREYKIGRIYDSLYYCRRWSGNSDAALDPVAVNKNNLYKDKLRAWEIAARIKINS